MVSSVKYLRLLQAARIHQVFPVNEVGGLHCLAATRDYTLFPRLHKNKVSFGLMADIANT